MHDFWWVEYMTMMYYMSTWWAEYQYQGTGRTPPDGIKYTYQRPLFCVIVLVLQTIRNLLSLSLSLPLPPVELGLGQGRGANLKALHLYFAASTSFIHIILGPEPEDLVWQVWHKDEAISSDSSSARFSSGKPSTCPGLAVEKNIPLMTSWT